MDIYDTAIEYFKAHPDQIQSVWDDPKSHSSGVLFRSVTPSGFSEENPEGFFCGDLCEIRSFLAHAWTNELEEEINADARLPKLWANNDFLPKLTFEHLDVYAEWQRKIDMILDRDPTLFSAQN